MTFAESTTAERTAYGQMNGVASASAVSWGAIVAGATIAAATSLVLLSLGVGLGLSSISPWAQKGVQASTFGFSSIVWVIVTQLCASALGGYLAGRLRTRWSGVHTDEVYFRDTAHGLLTWAMATLVTTAIVLAAAAGAVGVAAQASATLASGAAVAGTSLSAKSDVGDMSPQRGGAMGYLVDSLFRKDAIAPGAVTASGADSASTAATRLPLEETTRIFANASSAGMAALPQSDVRYLGQEVSQRTGLPQNEAERRVTETYAALQTGIGKVKAAAAEAADKARKAGIKASLWLFIALLSGAFIASYTALLGGRERDA